MAIFTKTFFSPLDLSKKSLESWSWLRSTTASRRFDGSSFSSSTSSESKDSSPTSLSPNYPLRNNTWSYLSRFWWIFGCFDVMFVPCFTKRLLESREPCKIELDIVLPPHFNLRAEGVGLVMEWKTSVLSSRRERFSLLRWLNMSARCVSKQILSSSWKRMVRRPDVSVRNTSTSVFRRKKSLQHFTPGHPPYHFLCRSKIHQLYVSCLPIRSSAIPRCCYIAATVPSQHP